MKSEKAVATVVQVGLSQSKLRAQAKARKRMAGIVASLQAYVGSYDKQSGYTDYTDKTLIDDMLYGLGLAMDPKAHNGADGYEAFREVLQRHLVAESGMKLAEQCYRLPDGSRIEQSPRRKGAGNWAVFREGRVLHVDGSWQWAKVPTDEQYLATCRYPSARDAYDAWAKAHLGGAVREKITKPKRLKAA
jgi:hypothetical protein